MSMSTQHGGGNRRPSTVKPGGKPTGGAARAGSLPVDDEPVDALETDEVDDDLVDAELADEDLDADLDADLDEDLDEEPEELEEPAAPPGRRGSTSRSTTSTTRTTGRTGVAKAGSARPGARPIGKAAKGGGRRPITPVKVSQGRNWGPIAVFAAVAALAIGIIGYAGWQVHQNSRTFDERAADIGGVVNYRNGDSSLKQPGQHAWGPLTYKQSPPIGGKHNPNWQNCMGDVYDAQIANEHAVHSMEHGAVWVTYNPDKLSKDQVEVLAKKVRGKDYTLMSPYPSLDKPISLQAWGYQLKLDNVNDKRIDEFIGLMRQAAAIEKGVQCSGGITETGTTPRDLGKDQPQQPQQPQQPGG
jgi:Protein of unknown function (DUF3105)